MVIGGGGFIGRSVVKFLSNDNYEVVCVDNSSRNAANEKKMTDIKIKDCDVLDRDRLFSLFEDFRPEMVVNLAYVNGTKNFYLIPDRIADVAVRGQLNVIDAANRFGVSKIVYFSSSEAYGYPGTVPTRSDEPLKIMDLENPRWSYGGGKVCAEYMLKYLSTADSKLVIRPHNVYGPNMGQEHVIPELGAKVIRLKNEGPKRSSVAIPVQGKGLMTRSFIYIDDFTAALGLIIDRNLSGAFNVGWDDEVQIADILRYAEEFFETKIEVLETAVPEGSVVRRVPEVSVLKQFGFSPKIGLREGCFACWESLYA